jgi:hypothetical protein
LFFRKDPIGRIDWLSENLGWLSLEEGLQGRMMRTAEAGASWREKFKSSHCDAKRNLEDGNFVIYEIDSQVNSYKKLPL